MKAGVLVRASTLLLVIGLAVTRTTFAGEQLVLATGEATTPAYHAGIGLASLIKVDLGPDYKIDLKAINSSGPAHNIRLMQEGAADLAILPSMTGHAARAAIGSFAGYPPERQLRAVTMLWREALHLVVRGDDASTGTIDDFLNLKGRKVFLGNEATGASDANYLLLSELGLDIDKAFDISSTLEGDIVRAVNEDRLDAFIIASRSPSLRLQTMSPAETTDLVFLRITPDQMIRANGSHWLWTPYTIQASTYPWQREDIDTIAHAHLLAVNAEISEETVYLITRSIFENLPYLYRVDPGLADLVPDQALSGMSLPLHPGALRYFKEAGIIPDILSPDAPSNDPRPFNRNRTSYPNSNVAEERKPWSEHPMPLARYFGAVVRKPSAGRAEG